MISRLLRVLLAVAMLPSLLLLGCAETVAPPTDDEYVTPPVEDDLVAGSPGGKFDTGYYSNLAAELEGRFTAHIVVNVSDRTQEEREAEVQRLTDSQWAARNLIDAQLKYAKNKLNASALHLNLSSGDLEVSEITLSEGGIITINYQTTAETVVTSVELEESGTTIQELLQTTFDAIVPDDPSRMHTDVGAACLSEEHEGDPHAYNYFYYFAPDREGCAEAMAAANIGRVTATFEIRNLAPTETVFPEYDQLTADNRIDAVVFFGAADHDWEPGKWDWGVRNFDMFTRDLRSRNFTKGEAEHGEFYTRTVNGLVENVTVVGPETLKLLRDDADGLFGQMVGANELIFYNGHSFYGSLSVLDDESIYPGHYQIYFMDSCWSYEYYTKQVFRANATEEDPDGWLMADVVNNTEVGWFHNNPHESRILLTNILAGAENNGVDGDRYYTWDRIIGAMSDYAIQAQRTRGTDTHEIFGVSGITTNQFDPTAVEPPPAGGARYEANNRVEIPDNNADGASDVIVVPAGQSAVQSVHVEVTIEHTWVGDLEVTLHHGDRYFTLHGQSGGSADNLDLDLTTDQFDGMDAEGDWTLKVVDNAGYDTGALVSWSIEL